MKIAFITEHYFPKVDGIVTRLNHTLTNLQKSNIEIIVITSSQQINTSSEALENGILVYRLPSIPVLFNPEKRLIIPTKKMEKIIVRFNPDVIHVINPSMCGYNGLKLAKKHRIYSVASQHSDYAAYLNYFHLGVFKTLTWEWITKSLNYADRALCTSIQMYDALKAHGVSHLDIWQPGVAIDEIIPALQNNKIKKKLGANMPHHFLLIYVGRLSAEKNIELIKPALLKNPNIHLAIIGEGPKKRTLMKNFIGTNTTFLKYLNGRDLATVYASADALILPSSTETLGLVLLEAMAAGIPTLGANAGGIPSIIEHGKNGFLFPPHSAEAISETLSALIQLDNNALKNMKTYARQTAEKWSWKNATTQLLNFYQERFR